MSTDAERPEARKEEAAIAAYLARHPDFFERHPEVLKEMHIPHATRGAAVSLIERQVALLRQEKEQYKAQLEELVRVARENEALFRHLHQLTLALIQASDFDEVLNALQDELHDKFQADTVELRLFSSTGLQDHQEAAREQGAGEDEAIRFKAFFDAGRPVCGPLKAEQLHYLFGVEAEEIRSAALLPLQADGVLGLLAIGSRDVDHFHPNKGTDFLIRLAEVVSHTLRSVSLPGI